MGVYDFEQQEYNLKLAEALKKIPEFKKPEWADFVKSSSGKERPIDDRDFWHKRAASVLKQIYRSKVIGVSRLRTKYGTRKNRGMKPERFAKGSGKIIRSILQQCDKAGFTEMIKAHKGTKIRPGRKLTEKGLAFMEEIR
jgi:small subunit ribosomal protein S19e